VQFFFSPRFGFGFFFLTVAASELSGRVFRRFDVGEFDDLVYGASLFKVEHPLPFPFFSPGTLGGF